MTVELVNMCERINHGQSHYCFNTIYLQTFCWYGKHKRKSIFFLTRTLCIWQVKPLIVEIRNIFPKEYLSAVFTTLTTAVFSQWGMSTCRNSEFLSLEWAALSKIYTMTGLKQNFLWALLLLGVGRSDANELASNPVAEGIPDLHSTSNSWFPLPPPPPPNIYGMPGMKPFP